MRIIAGVAGGRRLASPATAGTRPVTERAREAVFSALGSVEGAAVADLYAGSGSFGLEALSRGAASAVFVERGRQAMRALRANIEAVGLGGEAVQGTVERFLAQTERRFDLVFADPPWELGSSEFGRVLITVDGVLEAGGRVVLSRRQGDDIPESPENWDLDADKGYGDTRILRYRKIGE